MMKPDHFNFSVIEYRANPSQRDENPLVLGFVLEFMLPDFYVVACAMLDPLEKEKLERMDPLTRELLEKPGSLLDEEIRTAITNTNKPGDVLKYLAANNPWSIHVCPPEEVETDSAVETQDMSIVRTAEQHLHKICEMLIVPKESAAIPDESHMTWIPSVFRPREATRDDEEESIFSNLPPVWMTPPRTWNRPIFRKK